VLVSFLVLFQELVLIRWIPSQVRVAAYFPNLILISSFLGLGLGCLRGKRRSLLLLWPVGLLVLIGVSVLLSRVVFTANEASDHLWLLYHDLGESAPVVKGVRGPLVLLFVLTALPFVPLGQLIARRLEHFRRASRALWGYSLDLLGSLCGVVAFSAVAFLGWFPIAWFTLLLGLGLALMWGRRRRVIAYAAFAALAVVAVGRAEKADWYSPYYALSTDESPNSADLFVMTNGSLHQMARPLAKDDPIISEADQINRIGYHFPLERLRRTPKRALVLGAGTGNDVAVLLEHGVEQIDAVEIDPVILEIGRRSHPNRPYDSPRVTIYETDARSFLNDTDASYDLIVFGTLDSMTRLSALSNVRLDNFVYTLEGIRAARSHLASDGGLVMYFMVGKEHIHRHILAMLSETFGELPVLEQGDYSLFNVIYMAGPAFSHLRRYSAEGEEASLAALPGVEELPSDDWPYLYLESRSVSPFYLSLMAVFLLIAALAVFVTSRDMRRSAATAAFDGEMFLFGVAFLLLETRFVTAMNLVWGATWLTSAVVFGSILLMVLLATVLTQVAPIPYRVAAVGVIATLALVYLAPLELAVGRSVATRLGISTLVVGLPVFFASVCFATRFKAREAVDVAFGWNLLGAVVGGLLEFFSMSLGLGALLLLAAVAYLGAFLLAERVRQPAVAPVQPAVAPTA
jgi:hypothetical protein